MKQKCKTEAQKNLKEVKEEHRKELLLLEERMKEMEKEKEAVIKEFQKEKELRCKVQGKFGELVKEFQNFIDMAGSFDKGQSEFVLANFLQDVLDDPM